MIVLVPSPLHSYTGGVARLECAGRTLGQLLQRLNERYPGIRFRMIDEQEHIRTHIRVYADGKPVTALADVIEGAQELLVVAALSGG